MPDLIKLQTLLQQTGRYTGALDGKYGPQTRAAIFQAMRDGPETALRTQDYIDSGGRLACNPAYIMAFASVEAQGAGFENNEPKILFEPHVFSRLTKHQYDQAHPLISYPKWGTRPYPPDMVARYNQLLDAVGLDVSAGFSSASYGKFQLMGFNYAGCGFNTPWEFAFSQAFDEPTQLRAFEAFIRSDGLLKPLQNGNWVALAKSYNGPAYANNRYDVRLAQAARAFEQQLDPAP